MYMYVYVYVIIIIFLMIAIINLSVIYIGRGGLRLRRLEAGEGQDRALARFDQPSVLFLLCIMFILSVLFRIQIHIIPYYLL